MLYKATLTLFILFIFLVGLFFPVASTRMTTTGIYDFFPSLVVDLNMGKYKPTGTIQDPGDNSTRVKTSGNLLVSELLLLFLPFSFFVQCLCSPHGVVYLAAKKHYFGVGGGSRRVISIVEKDGALLTLSTFTLIPRKVALIYFLLHFSL
ncbi:hypothetical protein H5410_063651 [Solanum commersonii]|uniref:Transmembrane protein n=1 Tax=Solanum commersonii TaxID=4109 RepID=A0A9J5WEH1_SOLCO|nr:hypothetical protein H5410_063651 [Solanum commersonii]